MFSKIHKLYQKVKGEPQRDEYGRLTDEGSEEWAEVCGCRCDDADDREISTPNGELFRPTYHIICEGKVNVPCGADIRCMDGDTIRGEGTVKKRKALNFLNFTELWI